MKTWKDGMSSEELLDTWFLQLDKKDSPVTHKVVYQVTDSIGNIKEILIEQKSGFIQGLSDALEAILESESK